MNPTEARQRMVAAIAAERPAHDAAVLAALARVRREVFVPHFRSGGHRSRTFDVSGPDPNPDGLALLYDKDRAVAIRGDPGSSGGATSTASAPGLMATMLDCMALRPGLRVLEVGTGSGYNAAILSVLVGDPSLVTTVDIDGELANRAAMRLAVEGFGGVRVLVGDGTLDTSNGPFDRVVATVGCVDLAPAWLDELSPGGFIVVPLQHGAAHPLVRAEPDHHAAVGEVVGRSGFVPIQGRQAGRSPWIGVPPTGPPERSAALPHALVRSLSTGGIPLGGLWDLAHFVAASDRRGGGTAGLSDGAASAAWIHPTAPVVNWHGPAGDELAGRLVALAEEWTDLGRPGPEDFTCRFTRPAGHGRLGRYGDRWLIDRIDYRQILTLRDGVRR